MHRVLQWTRKLPGELAIAVLLAAILPAGAAFADQAIGADTIRLVLVRFDRGNGPVLISNGVPLPPGRLPDPAIGRVRLEIDGVDVAAFFRALEGRHSDGSVRALLLQFEYDVLPPTRLQPDVYLIIDHQSSSHDPPRSAAEVEYTYNSPLPPAVALPTDPQYIISSGIVGPTVPTGDPFARRYDEQFERWGEAQWNVFQTRWSTGLSADEAASYNYYDRALAHYAWWARTGDPEYWKRATYYLIGYRERYMRPNDYRVQPHNIQVEGLEVNYLLSGDEESRRGVRQIATYLRETWLPVIADRNNEYLEGRIQARTLQGLLAAEALGGRGHDFAAAAREALDGILRTQNADGSYTFANLCWTHYSYMTGLLNDVLIRYHDRFVADPRIVDAVRRSIEYMWTTQWVPNAEAFKYASGPCPGKADTNPAPDLNMQIVNGFGWLGAVRGDPVPIGRGDRIFSGGVKRAWLQGWKQFNENYAAAFRYLSFRRFQR